MEVFDVKGAAMGKQGRISTWLLEKRHVKEEPEVSKKTGRGRESSNKQKTISPTITERRKIRRKGQTASLHEVKERVTKKRKGDGTE